MSAQTDNLKMTLPIGTENITRSIINGNFGIVDAAVGSVQDGLAIVADGNTHAAIANGQFVYVRNHTTLAEGLYKATTAISANAALSTSNLTADGSGGLNNLQSQVNTLSSNIANLSSQSTTGDLITGWAVRKKGFMCMLQITANISQEYSDGQTICTIPSGFRPWGQNVDTQIFDVTGNFLGTIRIYNTDGRITPVFGKLLAGNPRATIVYITA